MRVTDTASFIVESNVVHGNKYDYSKSIYVNQKTKIEIICKIHGSFFQIPRSHCLNGATCLKCSNEDRRIKKMKSTADFIDDANKKHGYGKYGFSELVYIGAKYKVKIECFKHGFFLINANSFLQGCGCAKCAIKNVSDSCRSNKSDFIKKSIAIHGDLFDYSKVKYITSKDKMEIICKKHGSFFQNANNHLQGKGCPICKIDNTGWTKDKFEAHCKRKGGARLYILECFDADEEFYKIGITSGTIKARFSKFGKPTTGTSIPYDFNVLFEFVSNGSDIWDLEKKLHEKAKVFKYKPRKKFGGHTECFSNINLVWSEINA